jgi:hypothetical protein
LASTTSRHGKDYTRRVDAEDESHSLTSDEEHASNGKSIRDDASIEHILPPTIVDNIQMPAGAG